jgi:hypothetical protein
MYLKFEYELIVNNRSIPFIGEFKSALKEARRLIDKGSIVLIKGYSISEPINPENL